MTGELTFASSEYYARRYNNFSTLVVFPIFAIAISLLLFSFVGKKEITVKSVGEIEPSQVIAYVQSTSNQRIVGNYLSENKLVHRGDVLITYDDEKNSIQLDALLRLLDVTNRQLEAVQKLKDGITDDGQPFLVADEFGYSSQLADYKAQVRAINSEESEENKTIDSENNSALATKDAIERQINDCKKQIDDYTELERAIKEESTLSDRNPFVENYKLYQSQIKANPQNRDSIARQLINEIDGTLLQLSANLGSLQAQLASSVIIKPQVDSASSRLEQLKSQYLLDSDRERSKLISTKLEIQTKISLTQRESTKSVVRAETSGVLHLNKEVKGMSEVPQGTVVAQIYPKLTASTGLNICLNIPVSEISAIREGQVVKLSNYKQHERPLIITGVVTSISTSPIRTEHGNYYEVRAKVNPDEGQLNYVRYGYQGTTVVVTGSKSYFNYYKDMLLHASN